MVFKATLLMFLFFVNSQASAFEIGECEAPPPRKLEAKPITTEERIQHFGADVGRALLRKWAEDKYSQVHNLSCIARFDEDGKVTAFKQYKLSKDRNENVLFRKLITELTCNARALKSLKSATLQIELERYPNAILRKSQRSL
ncbi:MAG: hypothetical protein IPL73_19220 [Candidatus Obscuribacter sp.]|nr:hypothetical protein [Candidatus Obscuribacter sp.]MBK9622344.1 hypothetical protein [Candidatus Obscuribacter sp.]